jgi:hypothetical protein
MTEAEHKQVAGLAASFARADERGRCIHIVAKWLNTRFDPDASLDPDVRELLLSLAGEAPEDVKGNQ